MNTLLNTQKPNLGLSKRIGLSLLLAGSLIWSGAVMAQGNSNGNNANGLLNSSSHSNKNKDKEKEKGKPNLKEVVVPADVLKLVTCKEAISRTLNIPAAGKIIDGVLWDVIGKGSSATIYDKNGDGAIYTCPPTSGQQVLTIDQSTGVASCITFQCDASGNPTRQDDNVSASKSGNASSADASTPSITETFDCQKAMDEANKSMSGWRAAGVGETLTTSDGSVWNISCKNGGALTIDSTNPKNSKCNVSSCQSGSLATVSQVSVATKTFDCGVSKSTYLTSNNLSASTSETRFDGTKFVTASCPTDTYLGLNSTTPKNSTCVTVACVNSAIKATSNAVAITPANCNIPNASTTIGGQTASCPAGSGNAKVVTLSSQTCTTKTEGVGETQYNLLYKWQLQGGYCESNHANQDDWTKDDCHGTYKGQKVYCKRFSNAECLGKINKQGKCMAGWPGSPFVLNTGFDNSNKPFYFGCEATTKTCVADQRAVCSKVESCNGGTPVFSSTSTSSVNSKTGSLPAGLVDADVR